MIEKIRRLVLNYSKGKVLLTDNVIKEIIDLVQLNELQQPFVKLYRFNSLRGHYELLRTVKMTEAGIKQFMIENIGKKVVKGFYKYEVYNSQQNQVDTIYSVNIDLL